MIWARADYCVALTETARGIAKLLRITDAWKVMGMFKETLYLFRLQPPAYGNDQKVIRHVSDEITASKRNAALIRMNSSHFALDELDPTIEHRLAYIEGNVVLLASPERSRSRAG